MDLPPHWSCESGKSDILSSIICPMRSGSSDNTVWRLAREKGADSDEGESRGTKATKRASRTEARNGRKLQGTRLGATFLTSHSGRRSVLSASKWGHRLDGGGLPMIPAVSCATKVESRSLSPARASMRRAAAFRSVQSAIPWRRKNNRKKASKVNSGQAVRVKNQEESGKTPKISNAKPKATPLPSP